MAGLHHDHLPALQAAVPQCANLTHAMFRALTAHLTPHLPALPAFTAMAEAVEREEYGVLHDYRLVRLPLSIVGIDKVRYRTPVVSLLHETILSLRMSEITINKLRTALHLRGLCLLFLCSCGVVMGRCPDVRRFYGSGLHHRMDKLRSAIDAAGYPVREVATLRDIPVATMDLHTNGVDARLIERISDLIETAAAVGYPAHPQVDDELAHFVARTQAIRTAA